MSRRTRRVQIDVPIHLTITLDGDPHDRTASYRALLDDIVESAERLARRYYLNWEHGETLIARLGETAEILDLDPPERSRSNRHGSSRRTPPAAAGAPPTGPADTARAGDRAAHEEGSTTPPPPQARGTAGGSGSRPLALLRTERGRAGPSGDRRPAGGLDDEDHS